MLATLSPQAPQETHKVADLFASADEHILRLGQIRVTDAHAAHHDLVVRQCQMFRDDPVIAIEHGMRTGIHPNARAISMSLCRNMP
jgi:hypothetical protein